MNVDKILAVADAIERHTIPDLGFNMASYYHAGLTDFSGRGCGTVACIAGWTNALFSMKDSASAILGIDADTAIDLFMPFGWREYHGQFTVPVAVRVLRNLAITGKVDWDAAMKDNDPVLPALPQPVVQCSTEDVS